jgi:hypothetical protein
MSEIKVFFKGYRFDGLGALPKKAITNPGLIKFNKGGG